MNKAVFFDRDGTINVEAGYIRDLKDLKLIEGASKSIAKLKEAGFIIILVTNQSGPARGYYSEEWVNTLNNTVQKMLLEEGTSLDEIYYCPHLPDGKVPEYTKDCDCRKPNIAMFLQGKEKYNLDFSKSFMVGDKATDVEAGHNAGCKSVLLKTGYGDKVLKGEYQNIPDADYIADDINAASDWILSF
ncbi:MAG: D-glycero-beta-D-manno-heptose 1,7-bisphosphate 7-phosphatase [Cyanobacteriota bacterium]